MSKKTGWVTVKHREVVVTAVTCDNCGCDLNTETARFGGHHTYYERREFLYDGKVYPAKFPRSFVDDDTPYEQEEYHEVRLCDKCEEALIKAFPCFSRRAYRKDE